MKRLLRLYPRAWRERYGEEFVATLGQGAPRPRQVIDIVLGAIDAWTSADVRRATRAHSVVPSGGAPMNPKSLLVCERPKEPLTTRDGWISAAVMIGATAIFCALGIAMRRSGWREAGEAVTSFAFFGALTLSMPFWTMKGQPWKVKAVIVGGTLLLLIAICFFASLI